MQPILFWTSVFLFEACPIESRAVASRPVHSDGARLEALCRILRQSAELLASVRDGSFARRWIEENQKGRPEFDRLRQKDIHHPIEEVGRRLRRMMPFVQPKEVTPGQGGA